MKMKLELLANEDYRPLLDCVGELYAHQDPEHFAERVLTAVRKVIASDYSTFNRLNLRRPLGCVSRSTEVIPPASAEPRKRALSGHSTRPHHAQNRLPSPPAGPGGGVAPAIAFIRSIGDFSEADREKLALLQPHIQIAYRLAGQFTELRKQNALLAEALAATRQAIIVLSTRGAMLFCNEPAQRCLARYFKLDKGQPHRLPEQIRTWLRQQGLRRAKNVPLPGLRQPFVAECGEGRLVIHAFAGETAGKRALVLEEQNTEPSVKLLQKQLRLTPREAEVLFWVSQGKMNAGIAVLLGLSAATVEKHLEHILAKLKVETRTAAAAHAHEVFNGKHFGP
jgi:DNA-binding NarL/FixJ family response regulator